MIVTIATVQSQQFLMPPRIQKPTKHSTSFLVVGGTRCNSLSFILEVSRHTQATMTPKQWFLTGSDFSPRYTWQCLETLSSFPKGSSFLFSPPSPQLFCLANSFSSYKTNLASHHPGNLTLGVRYREHALVFLCHASKISQTCLSKYPNHFALCFYVSIWTGL